MNVFAKAAIAGTLAAALAAGTFAGSAFAVERAHGLANGAAWSVAISPEYTTGVRPVDAVYLGAGQSWTGTVELNSDGELKFYVPRADGALGARWLFCGVEGAGAMDATVTVDADGSFTVACG
jgi:hypothetical protein